MPGTNNNNQDRILALDGLRGILALAVVAYHFFLVMYSSNENSPFHHAYLAVDFFFLLSGFVIGRSYDHRWPAMQKLNFFRARLIRLHPMVLIGLSLGILEYFADRAIWGGGILSGIKLILMVILQIFLLPSPDYLHGYPVTHPLNSPMWSLFQEYLVNLGYGLLGEKLTNKIVLIIMATAATWLIYIVIRFGNLGGGWDWAFFWVAPIRASFSFFVGLYIFRRGFRMTLNPTFPFIAFFLATLLIMPVYALNGLFDLLCVMLLFPFILIMTTRAKVTGWQERWCRFAGKISYPIYLVHYPVSDAFWHWVNGQTRSTLQVKIGVSICLIFCILLAWLVEKFLDKPIRSWLTGKYAVN